MSRISTRTDLKIPYGVADFKTISNEGLYQLFNHLRDSYCRTKLPDWIGWSMLASGMAYDGQWEPFLRRLVEDFANTTPIRGGIDGEIRLQGYMQAEFGHIRYYFAKPEMELAHGSCDFCLFPERVYNGDVRDSCIIELKYSKPDATPARRDHGEGGASRTP